MKRSLLILVSLALVFAGSILLWPGQIHATGDHSATWEVYFSPSGGCTQAIVDTLATAKKSVLVQAYSFTSAPIAKALVDAKKRGVDVQAILDKSQRTEKYSGATFLLNAGIPTFIDPAHTIAHNKVMVIDGKTVITGSFNFTKAAENNNAENLLILRSEELAARYTDNWKHHLGHSVPYAGHTKVFTSRSTQKQETGTPPTPATSSSSTNLYIGNTKSQVFHLPTCSSLPSQEHSVIFHSRAEAIAAGYRPCKRCSP